MTRHTFPSLTRDGIAYTVHDDHMALWGEWYRANGALCAWAGYFNTYGDGLDQHGFENVITANSMPDYFRSLSSAALDRPEIGLAMYRVWPDTISRNVIDFILSVTTPKDDRSRWISISREKVTTKDMSHDRRWSRLPRCAFNGSTYGAWAILSASDYLAHKDMLSRILTYRAIRDEVLRRDGACGKPWWDEFGFAPEHFQGGREFDSALELAVSVVGMTSCRRTLERVLRSAA